MQRLLLVGIAGIVALGLWFLLGRGVERGPLRAAPPPEAGALPERIVADLDAPPGGRSAVAEGDARVAAVPVAERVPEAKSAAGSPVHVHGRVLDAAGQGLAGVSVVRASTWSLPGVNALPGAEIAVSGAGGVFEAELVLGRESTQLECARDGRLLTLRAARLARQDAAHEQLIVVAPAIELAGTVSAAGGAPLGGAQVGFQAPIEAFAGFPVPLDGTVSLSIEATTGADGRFAHLGVPSLAGAGLHAQHAGYRSQGLAAPTESRGDLWIELEPLTPKEPWLRGMVVHADGTPAKDATVRLDSLATESASDGTFALEKGEWADPEAPLVAALRGFQPAVLARAGELLEQEFAPAPVRLVLGGPALAIAGKILDAAGAPCRGWQVSLLDGTVVTTSQVPFDLAEDLACGKKVATKSDKQGAFELGGLLAREYVVQAYDPRSLLMLRSEPVAAGTRELVLRVPENALFARLAGRVVGRDGRPIADASLSIRLVIASNGGAKSFQNGKPVNTDADGRFELTNVPRRFAGLDVDGELVIPTVFELEDLFAESSEDQDLRLEVARRCHLRVELAPADESAEVRADGVPNALVALDAGENELALYTFQGSGWSSGTQVGFSSQGTHPIAVSEDAHTLVFSRNGNELRRVEVTLVPGELSVIRVGRESPR